MVTKSFKPVRRRDMPNLNNTMVTLLVALVALLTVAVLLVAALLFLRQRRKTRRAASLPPYNENRLSTSSVRSYHRRVTARPPQSIHVLQERQLPESSSDLPPPTSAIPEIRITFPEEVDSASKRQSGRVVVVHVGDSSLGMEPVAEKLPYQQYEGERFQSIDLERVGGLEEKESRPLGWN